MTRAKSAQLKMEHYYKVAVDSAIERNTRCVILECFRPTLIGTVSSKTHPSIRRVELERRLQSETMMSEERKNRQLQQLGKKESTFLRLKRTKLGLDDFRTVKVIGKGAFGEVGDIAFLPILDINYVAGQVSPEDRHRKDIRHEAPEERRNVEERSGTLCPYIIGCIFIHYLLSSLTYAQNGTF